MPEPIFLVRRSARSPPVKVLRATSARYSSFLRNSSSNSARRSRGAAGFTARRAIPLRRLRGLGHQVVDDRVGVDPLGLALEVEQDAVAQRRVGDVAQVVDRDGEAILQERADL